ncbi:hypothetical protein [Streptomyces sp. NBC_01264]|uniref:hypothetical protein n=1 Tax=Streptomyces sp. NBC_01264 TaxID=2903804 RepID=UPI0022505306|nr:hypothetical protein [Streptomyces sp. NBC_01264]MCX4775818.1 hypothetical protein [Streptomyces sp. NBC_01264]
MRLRTRAAVCSAAAAAVLLSGAADSPASPHPVNRLGTVLARITVIAQYDYKLADSVYKLADKSQKIGTITAYCERVARKKCPNAVNET